jgi:hypothetical protein
MPEGGNMTTNKSPKDLEDKIRTWLMEDGWSLRKETPQGGLWAFVADDGRGRKIVVGQNANREDAIILQGGINIDDNTSREIDKLPEGERNDFLWDLRFALLRTNLEFSGITLPLKRIELMERIVIDAPLTKDCFVQRTSEVKKGVLLVLWMLSRKFAQQIPNQQMGFQR